MALQATTEVLITANPARGLVFFPGGISSADDSVICYNYKTGQWTAIPAYDGIGTYTVSDKTRDIGLVRFSSGSVDLQDQLTSYPAQTATIETGSTDINKGGRAVVDGVRPLVNGGTTTVRVGIQDNLDDAVTYSTGTALNSRTNMANFRSGANTPEGRYLRVELSIASGFTTAMGADIDYSPQGRV